MPSAKFNGCGSSHLTLSNVKSCVEEENLAKPLLMLGFMLQPNLQDHRLIWECCTDVIAVTNKSKEGMIEDGIPESKIALIPTGFDVREYENVETSRIEQLRAKYIGNHQGPVIGVAARYVRWKGVELRSCTST